MMFDFASLEQEIVRHDFLSRVGDIGLLAGKIEVKPALRHDQAGCNGLLALQHADEREGSRLRDQSAQLVFAFRVIAPATADVDDVRPVCSQELVGKQVQRLPPL